MSHNDDNITLISSAMTNANIVFETKIRIIDILQVCLLFIFFIILFLIIYPYCRKNYQLSIILFFYTSENV